MSKVPQLRASDIEGENMKTRYLAITAFILLSVAFLNAQPPGKKPVTTRPAATTAGSNQASSGFEFEVSITPLGLAGVNVRKRSGLGLFTPSMLNSLANYLNAEQAGRPTTTKASKNPSFVIRPEKDAKMAEILDVINAIRVSPKTDMRIEIDADLTIFIPKKPDPKGAFPRPNPLTLVVNVDEVSNISLNGQKEGSFPDTSKLEKDLTLIFQEREKNGIWREGTNTTDTTVFVRLAKNMTFANVAQLARAIKRGGSDAIGLQIDETDNEMKID